MEKTNQSTPGIVSFKPAQQPFKAEGWINLLGVNGAAARAGIQLPLAWESTCITSAGARKDTATKAPRLRAGSKGFKRLPEPCRKALSVSARPLARSRS